MTISNKLLKILLILLIVVHAACLIIGMALDALLLLASSVNLLAGGSVILYWVVKQLRITQHSVEWRESFFLLSEFCIVLSALYFFMSESRSIWVLLIQYMGLGFHTITLMALLIFALTFKMKKLI